MVSAELLMRQEEVKAIANEAERQKAMENIQNFESQVRELSKKCDLESVLREELSLEIQTLQRSQMKSSWNSATQDTSTQISSQPGPLSAPSTLPVAPSVAQTATSPMRASEPNGLGTAHSLFKDQSVATAYQQTTSVKYSIEGPIVSEVAIHRESGVASQTDPTAALETTNNEINRILARIEQDNRLLAELESSRTTIELPLVTHNAEKLKEESKKEKIVPQISTMKQSVTIQQLEQLMAKLEQDNKILAELDKKRNVLDPSLGWKGPINGPITPSASLGSLRDPNTGSHFQGLSSSISMHHTTSGHTLLPTSLLQRFSGIGEALTEEEMLDSIDFIELPGRGRCNIFCARYTYDPLKQSPNENPEAELALGAGDYVIIYGEMDEDGFFNGELLDGRKGLVPSNFVEKLSGEELFDFHATVLYGNRDSDDSSVSFSYAQDMEMTVSDDYLLPEDIHRMNDYIDLEDIEDIDEDNIPEGENEGFSRGVPPPHRLILERQLNKSLLLGWVPPDVAAGSIEGYHVYVDGLPRATIKFSERTRALIEGVDSSRPHRISVRSISSAGFHSKDAACTIVVGKDFPLAPTCVKASQVTATSALVSWLPSNSNFQHVVAVNSVEVKTVRPGCFRHRVTGLSPNNLYRVSVRVRPGKLLYSDEKNPRKLEMLVSNVEFRTLPKGLPDPPVNVQVEQGPQDGTLLVTWLPVAVTASPLVSSVVGYAVFAAGKRVAEIDSPSGDHALIDGSHLLALNKKSITVKSKCMEGLSGDSQACVVPNDILRSIQKSLVLSARMLEDRRERRSSSDSESDTELTELLNHVTRKARTFEPMDSPFGVGKGEAPDDLQIEGLSDIVEEEEEPWTDAGEGKPRMTSKVENINETEEYHFEDNERNMPEHQNYYQKPISNSPPNHMVRRSNTPPNHPGRRPNSPINHPARRSNSPPNHPARRTNSPPNHPARRTNSPPNHPARRTNSPPNHPARRTNSPPNHPTRRSNSPPRRTNPNPPPSPVPSQRRQGWREQSYNSRSAVMEENGIVPDQRMSHREQRNSSGQIILDPDENLSDKEIYPPSRTNIPSIEITKDSAVAEDRLDPSTFSDDDYVPRRRSRSDPSQPPQDRHGHHSRGPAHQSKQRRPSHDPPTQQQQQPRQRAGDAAKGPRGGARRRSGPVAEPMRRRMPDLGGYEEPEPPPSRPGGEIRDNAVRYFVALFDYDPQTMSPNPDAADDELPFREGHVIKIYGDKDPDGFYRGECKGQIGLVPGNMVSELTGEPPPAQYNDNVARPKTLGNIVMDEMDGDLNWDSRKYRKMIAIYDYDPQEISPNVDSEMELSFSVGDLIYVYGEPDEDGFFVGEVNGVRGLVPSNFLTEVPLDDGERRHSLGGRPKARSYLNRSDCPWNAEEL